MPEVGSQRSSTEKTKISMMASQKLGIDWPSTATTLTDLSTHVLRFTAAATPRTMPITVLNTSAGAPDKSEFGNLSAIRRRDVTFIGHRFAEIAADRVGNEDPVLHGHWLIKAELLLQHRHVLRRGLIGYQQRNWVSGGPSQDEDDHRDNQKCHY